MLVLVLSLYMEVEDLPTEELRRAKEGAAARELQRRRDEQREKAAVQREAAREQAREEFWRSLDVDDLEELAEGPRNGSWSKRLDRVDVGIPWDLVSKDELREQAQAEVKRRRVVRERRRRQQRRQQQSRGFLGRLLRA